MPRIARLTLPVAAASAVGFAIHKLFADWLPSWLAERMAGVEIKRAPYGPEVVVPAAISYLEYGVAFLVAYMLIRRATPQLSTLLRALLLAALCLSLQGAVLRWPIMQLVIGNPLWVTVVQHASIWLPYVAASLVLAYAYEALFRREGDRSIERAVDRASQARR